MAHCSHCGAEILPGARFCTRCGTKVEVAPNAFRPADAPGAPRAANAAGALRATSEPGVMTLSTWEADPPEKKPKKPAAKTPAKKGTPEKKSRKIGCWGWIFILLIILLVFYLIGEFG